jgi:hypothetical protein
MSAEKSIYGMMAAHAPLTAVVPVARINPSVIPLGSTLPAIAYSLVSRVEETAVGLTTIIARSRIQITIAVSGTTPASYASIKNIAKLVKAACNNKRGTFNTIDVKSSILELEGADFRDDQSAISYSTIDFRVVTLE